MAIMACTAYESKVSRCGLRPILASIPTALLAGQLRSSAQVALIYSIDTQRACLTQAHISIVATTLSPMGTLANATLTMQLDPSHLGGAIVRLLSITYRSHH
jgi:hypothetical protein